MRHVARAQPRSLIRETKLVIANAVDVAFFNAFGFDTLTCELDSIRAAQVFHEVHAVVKHDGRVPSRNVSVANGEVRAPCATPNDKLVFVDGKGLVVELKHQDSAARGVGRAVSGKWRWRRYARLRSRTT